MAILKGDNKKNILNGGLGDDFIYGYGDDDILTGDAGNDTLNGGQGADTLIGGIGNDIYLVDNALDAITEQANEGTDTVKSTISWKLGDNLEKLALISSIAINGTGNSLDNTLIGNNANNILSGGAGNDTLNGNSGDDILLGGVGNDTFYINEFGNDAINGGTGVDTLRISGHNQWLNLGSALVKDIETITFANDSNSTLQITAESVINLSGGGNTLKLIAKGNNTLVMDSGWSDGGIANGYHTFTKEGATLLVDPAIDHIKTTAAYTVSNAATAEHVSDVFNGGVQEITIDLGGSTYSSLGLDSIDLGGFGLEDKLIIAQHDGALSLGTAWYGATEHNYIVEAAMISRWGHATDRVSWQAGASNAKLISHVYRIDWPSTFTGWQTISYTNTVQLTGLPTGLPTSQFVFV